ncbi:MAG: hypothetical protein WD875_12320 [Pirellulales bacterium]
MPAPSRSASRQPSLRRTLLALVAIASVLAAHRPSLAGGGPENLLLLVNSQSATSRAVANYYAQLRSVPPSNIVSLDVPVGNKMSVADFRTKVLMPALSTMAARGIGGQIDYIVYSADFPTQIDLSGDGRPQGLGVSKPDPYAPTGSINSMTFLWQMTMTERPNYYHPTETNRYFRHPADPLNRGVRRFLPTQAFSSWRGWDESGDAKTDGGIHYYLSTMLGVTGSRGNTPAEIVAYLSAAAKADGTHPRGTIYYVQSEDKARSGPRQGGYDAAVKELARLGVRGEVLHGQLPIGKPDVQGTMMGVAKFDWDASGSRILPGAICDHLTSFGGLMSGGGSQSPLTAYLKYGAAGACGTVVEPLNIPDKFPNPNIHVHYAAGCSLAEAFYQSIGWPYQVLIVGDPLCQPWANIPKVTVDGITPNARTRGTLTVTPAATVAGTRGIARFDLFIDGVRRDKIVSGESFSVITNDLPDGYHELRVVAVEGGPIESQGRAVVPFWVNNHGKVLAMSSTARRVRSSERIEIKVNGSGAARVVVTHQGRDLGEVAGSAGRISVRAKDLGPGPATLHATSYAAAINEKEPPKPLATAAPLEITVLEN